MIRFKYTPSFESFWRLNRRLLIARIRFLVGIAAVLLILWITMPLLANQPGQTKTALQIYVMTSPLLFLPAVVTLVYVLTYVGTKKRWSSSEEVRSEREYEIGEEGIQIRGDGVNGFMEWRHFVGADLSKGWITIRTSQQLFHYFPEAAVPDSAALRQLLKQKIPKARI